MFVCVRLCDLVWDWGFTLAIEVVGRADRACCLHAVKEGLCSGKAWLNGRVVGTRER